jgi:PilZ domain
MASKKTPPTAASAAPSSLEFPTTVSARGLAPAQAIIEHLTVSEARLRSVLLFDHNSTVEFSFGLSGRASVIARGRIVSRTQSGPRFIYRVVLDRMSGSEADELARTVRVSSEFGLQLRTAKEGAKPARCADISAGGMMVACKEVLVEGMAIEVRFTLPEDVLDIYPEETVTLDIRKREVVRSTRSDLRRPFGEMVILARVASHQILPGGEYAYGLAFHNLDAYTAEEIARYTHAAQLAKKRRSNA